MINIALSVDTSKHFVYSSSRFMPQREHNKYSVWHDLPCMLRPHSQIDIKVVSFSTVGYLTQSMRPRCALYDSSASLIPDTPSCQTKNRYNFQTAFRLPGVLACRSTLPKGYVSTSLGLFTVCGYSQGWKWNEQGTTRLSERIELENSNTII